MSEDIIIALITVAGSLIGSVVGAYATIKAAGIKVQQLPSQTIGEVKKQKPNWIWGIFGGAIIGAVITLVILGVTGIIPVWSTHQPTPPTELSSARRYGMVIDTGGISDNSFNQISWEGMQRAKQQLDVEVTFLESRQESDYTKNLNRFIQQGYDGVIAVGFRLADATNSVSAANPTFPIAIVDFPSQTSGDMGLLFAVDEPSFLAGYLAAGMTRTGIVCTFGGMKITPVTQFMIGFEQGILHYNQQHGTNVQLRGWETNLTQEGDGEGIFVGNFEDAADGRLQAEECFNAGGDIIFPVAGAVEIGSAAATSERSLMMIGTDIDHYEHFTEYQESYLTSVLKNLDQAVFETIKAMNNETFKGGTNYVGTLQNGGVGLAPFHDYEDEIPESLKVELNDLAIKISSGRLSTGLSME